MKKPDYYVNTQRWREKARRWATAYAGGRCQSCGYDAYFGNLCFHHLTGKDSGISEMINRCSAWAKILEEVDKTVLVCANCHGEIHAGLREVPRIDRGARASALLSLIPEIDKMAERRKRTCLHCGAVVGPFKIYCDAACSAASKEKISWPNDLLVRVKASSIRAVAKDLGVSWHAVNKRLQKTVLASHIG